MSPDITLCKDGGCPRNKECYRYTATPSEYQYWFIESPRKGKKCEFFMGNLRRESRHTEKELDAVIELMKKR